MFFPDIQVQADISQSSIIILLPLYDDWIAVQKLLAQLDGVMAIERIKSQVLIVDDGSPTGPPSEKFLLGYDFKAIIHVEVLHLRRNLGHQRALAIGLAYIEARMASCRAVVVMDSDGEDDPRDVPRLLEWCQKEAEHRIIFAERTRRAESILFRLFYLLYRGLHAVLTGRGIRFGNFSVIPRSRLSSLVVVSELWNHYAAAVCASRQPFTSIPATRAKRLHGHSKMNFVQLVTHGLSAIATYSDVVGVRMLLVVSSLIVLVLIGIISVVTLRVLTDLAIPGWATFTGGILFILLVQSIMFSFIFSFFILAGRKDLTFLPMRDYIYFIDRVETVYKRR